MTGPSSPTTTRRRVRHVDIWSVFKISLLFFFVCGIVWLVAVVIVWNVINAFGWVSQLEGLTGKLVGGSFRLDTGTLLRAAVLIDLVTVGGFTIGATLLAVLYNLISDVVGGVNVTVEEVAGRRDRRLLSSISLPFRRNRKQPAVDGIESSRSPVAAAAGRQASSSQPRRPPAGGGAVTVKRAPQPTRGANAGGSGSAPGDGAATATPKAKPAPGRTAQAKPAPKDGPSVAPVPPKPAQKTPAKPAAPAKAEGKG